MATVGIRELARRASAVMREVRETGKPAVVTDRGKPVGVIYPIEPDSFEDHVLANAPEFIEDLRQADEALRAGRTRSLSQALEAADRADRDRARRRRP